MRRHFYPVHSLGCLKQSMANIIKLNLIVFKFSQTYIKKCLKFWGFQIRAYFISSFSGCWVISNFANFHLIKVAKQSWDPCYHLAAETGSWFILILTFIYVRTFVILNDTFLTVMLSVIMLSAAVMSVVLLNTLFWGFFMMLFSENVSMLCCYAK